MSPLPQVGSVLALELRHSLESEHGLTSSAGVSYNKLLAKVTSSRC